jgi:hypothetical protein
VLTAAVANDLNQLLEYGVDVDPLRHRFDKLVRDGSLDELAGFQLELWQIDAPPDYPYDEPSDPEAICALWPEDDGPAFEGGEDVLHDRLAGAWLGRAAGCCLGKPLEIGVDRREVEAILRALDSWPLLDYLNTWPEDGFPQALDRPVKGRDRNCTRPLIDHCPNDDDINYPLASLMCLEKHGADWTPEALFKLIADITPWSRLWSSGKNGARAALEGIPHPGGQLFGNPTRQSLGAMIRCDTWAYVTPGARRRATEFALHDAVYTQTRNGIYAGVYWTVAIQAALTTGDVDGALRVALKYVPPRSKYAEMVNWCFERPGAADWADAVDALYERYGYEDLLPKQMAFNHCLINGGLVLLGVLYGEGDFSRTIGLTVAGGRDTDCTGATAGSLMGAACGFRKLPPHWIRPLNDTYRSVMLGCHELSFSDIVRRTEEQARKFGRMT